MNKIENKELNSPIKNGLKNIAGFISIIINKKLPYIKPNYITTFGLVLNAFGLLNLLKNEFGLFIILFCASYFCDILDGVYARKFNLETKIGKLYDKFADWIRLLTTYTIFSALYKRTITYYHIIFVVVILCACNFHFILKKSIKKYQTQTQNKVSEEFGESKQTNNYENNSVITNFFKKDNLDSVQNICIDLYISCFKKIEIKKMKRMLKISKYFDETMVIFYIILTMIYINQQHLKN